MLDFLIFFCLFICSVGFVTRGRYSIRARRFSNGLYVKDFPILQQKVNDKKIVYLDSAASSQKPEQVCSVMNKYYLESHSNVHRGIHFLANRATDSYEKSRIKLQRFINARHSEEDVFTAGATDSLNIIAKGCSEWLNSDDEIILSIMEHHSNIVPWQLISKSTGAKLKYVQLTPSMELDMDHYRSLLSPKTKIVSVSHVSNVLGCVNPVKEIIDLAHMRGDVITVLDSSQGIAHLPVNVQQLDVDFLAASAHKMCGPTGVGLLYSKRRLLEKMSPVKGGGEMVDLVELDHSTYAPLPHKFEAGTPPIAEAIGFGAACDYLTNVTMKRIKEHDQRLGTMLYESLAANFQREKIQLYGPRPDAYRNRVGLVSFNIPGIHPTDLAFFLDKEGVAVRSGTHCTQPLHRSLQCSASLRASSYFYNSANDIDLFIMAMRKTVDLLKKKVVVT